MLNIMLTIIDAARMQIVVELAVLEEHVAKLV